MKKIAILGSTGSIGTQTLEIVESQKDIQVTALAAGSNITLLEQQIRKFHPSLACVWDDKKAQELKTKVADLSVRVVSGMEGLLEVAVEPQAGLLVTGIVGMIGIRPTIAAMKAGKDIALANKETLVTAGHIIMPLAKECGVRILPVDSEHSAIFQCLNGEDKKKVTRLLLTASGGPFRGWTKSQLEQVRVEDALRHPNWSMGRKLTVDSSTMVNKGLEMIEARYLFGVDMDHIEVVVQPQSVIHSMVEYEDGTVIAQMSVPDMKLPIQYAIYYPERRYLAGGRLDFAALGQITFEKPDSDTFRGLALAYEAERQGGSMRTVFNAANEYAVGKFLKGEISWLMITEMIEKAMARHQVIPHPDVEQILAVEQETYEYLRGMK